MRGTNPPMPTTRTISGLFILALLAGCDSDESVQFRADDTGTDTGHPCEETGDGDGDGDGDPGVAAHVCGGTDANYLYIEQEPECDVGYVHYCYVGVYAINGIISICCDPNTSECSWTAFGSQCSDGLAHVCDRM